MIIPLNYPFNIAHLPINIPDKKNRSVARIRGDRVMFERMAL